MLTSWMKHGLCRNRYEVDVGEKRIHCHLGEGDALSMRSYGALQGPILIEVHGSQVALGRGIASRIIVEEVQ